MSCFPCCMLQRGMLHLICVAPCILPVLHAACFVVSPFFFIFALCFALLLHSVCCILSVVQAARCLLHPVRFAIIAAIWDSRCILHLSCCASHGVLTACLPRAYRVLQRPRRPMAAHSHTPVVRGSAPTRSPLSRPRLRLPLRPPWVKLPLRPHELRLGALAHTHCRIQVPHDRAWQPGSGRRATAAAFPPLRTDCDCCLFVCSFGPAEFRRCTSCPWQEADPSKWYGGQCFPMRGLGCIGRV